MYRYETRGEILKTDWRKDRFQSISTHDNINYSTIEGPEVGPFEYQHRLASLISRESLGVMYFKIKRLKF